MRRLSSGGLIHRAQPIAFSFDGREHVGFAGDSLASALLGAGVTVLGASVAHRRPRGVMSAGFEEATGYVQLSRGGVSEPLVRASGHPLVEGLALSGRIVKGAVELEGEPPRSDKRYAHVDVLVVGAGPAGLVAARTAAVSGLRVLLVESDWELGGWLLRDAAVVDSVSGVEWVRRVAHELSDLPQVRVLRGATASVALDQSGYVLSQRVGAWSPAWAPGRPYERLWYVRARHCVVATGSLERPVVFPDNDRPGVMLAGAAREYVRRYALVPQTGVVFTGNDAAYETALAWRAAGAQVAAVVDARPSQGSAAEAAARKAGIDVFRAAVVEGTIAGTNGALGGVIVRHDGARRTLACDVLAVSGGYEPFVSLYTQRGGTVVFNEATGAAVPNGAMQHLTVAGAAAGQLTLAACLASGAQAGREAVLACGARATSLTAAGAEREEAPALPVARVPAADGDESRSYVDLHRDVTVAGVERAVRAGLTHIEHIKRFTLAGTGVEQGRASKAIAGAVTAELTAQGVAEVGVAGGRPPVEPMSFAMLAGRGAGERFAPVRTTALHALHESLGAVFEPSGLWLRPSYYPRKGETSRQAIEREYRAVRTSVGLFDASTLGKIDVQGPDALWFLEQLYANDIGAIAVGKGRYSILSQLDGSLLDDGVVTRLGEQHFFISASTGHAAGVVDWMEEWRQTAWPERRVWITNVTEQWATLVVAGPQARALLTRVAPTIDWGRDAFPFLSYRRVSVAGVPAQVQRVSFSGELAFELSVPWHNAGPVWTALLRAGDGWGATPYGLKALQGLRIEKGYIIVGQDTESLTTPADCGLGWLVSKRKEYVGKGATARPAFHDARRAQLVGFVAEGTSALVEGAGIVQAFGVAPMPIEGHVTSAWWSPLLEKSLGLCLVRGGRARLGEHLVAVWNGVPTSIELVDAVHYDPQGARRDG